MKLTKKQISKILENWNLGELVSYKKADKGVVNHNWIIKTGKGKYILRRISRKIKLKELEFELKYTLYLRKNKFLYKIPVPINTKKGNSFIKFDNSYCWLYEFIEGENINRFDKPELKQVAKMMANYHSIIEKSGLDNKTNYSDFARKEILEEINSFRKKIDSSSKSDKNKIFLEESKKLIPLFNNLDVDRYSKLKKYPLHRDINPENTIWNNGKLIGLIDFENVSEIKDTFVKDIAGMLQYSCRDKQSKFKTDFGLAKFFIKEYRKFRPLSDEEISFIPEIIVAGGIEDFSYSYWMLLNDPKRAKIYRLRLYSKVAQWHWNNRDKLIKVLK